MTCIVAAVQDGVVWMGGDSFGSNFYDGHTVENPKVFARGNLLFGCTTSFRFIDLLRHSLNVPVHNRDEMTDDCYLRTLLVTAIRTCLKDGGFMSKSEEREEGGIALIGYHGNIYFLQDDNAIMTLGQTAHAVGSGDIAARGSLHTTRFEVSARERIHQALEAAEAITCQVRGPFIILEQEAVATKPAKEIG